MLWVLNLEDLQEYPQTTVLLSCIRFRTMLSQRRVSEAAQGQEEGASEAQHDPVYELGAGTKNGTCNQPMKIFVTGWDEC